MAPTSQPKRLSCVTCRSRKIKCNRLDPCNHCQKAGIPCVFPTPLRVKGGLKARNAEITNRLSRLENLLLELNGKDDDDRSPTAARTSVTSLSDTPLTNLPTPGPAGSGHAPPAGRTRPGGAEHDPAVKADGSRYLGDHLWASVSSEVDGLRQLLDDDSDEDEDEGGASAASSSRASEAVTMHPFFFRLNSPRLDLRQFHLYPPLISLFCDIYFERFDPCFKILHQPSIREAFQRARGDLDALTASHAQEALMFAFYFATITSLNDDECKQQFFDERRTLLARYKHATEVALANADFLNSQELPALQAFVIYVLCVRCSDDSRTAWCLISLASRIGQAMELQRDDELVAARTPFELEQRKRLWWGLMLVEGCLSEDRGTPVTALGAITPLPRPMANVNDSDLHPDMTAPPRERDECTDTTFSRVMHEASITMITLARAGASTTNAELEATVRQTKINLENKYLRHCTDPTSPYQWTAATVARCTLLRIWLVIYYPRHARRAVTRTQPTKAALLAAALGHLELVEALESYAGAARFYWFLALWTPWYPLVIVLVELCTQTHGAVVERAWALLADTELVAKTASRAADSQRGTLWTPVRKLWARAREVRAATLAARGDDPRDLGGSGGSRSGSGSVAPSIGTPGRGGGPVRSDSVGSPASAAELAAALPPAATVEGGTGSVPWDLRSLVPAGLAPAVQEAMSVPDAMTTGDLGELAAGVDGLGVLDGMDGVEAGLPPAWVVDWDQFLGGTEFM